MRRNRIIIYIKTCDIYHVSIILRKQHCYKVVEVSLTVKWMALSYSGVEYSNSDSIETADTKNTADKIKNSLFFVM